MSAPPLLLGAALLFWGWQTELFFAGAVAALLLEGGRLISWRFAFSHEDLKRVWSVCTILFLGMAGYLALTTNVQGATRAVLTMFQWYPLAVLPMIAAQLYSTAGTIDLSTLFLTVRRKDTTQRLRPGRTIDLSYPYFALCLLSASASYVKNPWFYIGLCLLLAWPLWVVRSKAFSPLLWAGALASVAVLGYGGHLGIHNLQRSLERNLIAWFAGLSGDQVDPYQTHTAIGSIGTVKLSDRIVLRLDSGGRDQTSLLLREASYDRYYASMWFARDSSFQAVPSEPDGTTWTVRSGPASGRSVTVYAHLKGGRGILALPNSVVQIEELAVGSMKQNRLGAVHVEEGPGLITYGIRSGGDASRDSPPGARDLSIPEAEAPVIARIAADLGLRSKPPREILRTVAGFFQTDFQYSTFQADAAVKRTALSEFLLRSRAGHCEYFATATVLLLRAAGIPARYAIGYSVQEFSDLEDLYVVRARHAHSWALVYVDGAWQNFDTTPVSWVQIEQEAAPWWERLYDVWSWGAFRFSKWRWSEREGGLSTYVGWLLIPLFVILAWRLYFVKRVARAGPEEQRYSVLRPQAGEDSEFRLIEQRLQELGVSRHPWEPLSRWVERLEVSQPWMGAADSLQRILRLHYRYRFDPNGLSLAERESLTSRVEEWLEQLDRRLASHDCGQVTL